MKKKLLQSKLSELKAKIAKAKRTLSGLAKKRQRILYLHRQPLRSLRSLELGYSDRVDAQKRKLFQITDEIRRTSALNDIGFVNPYSSESLNGANESELRLKLKSHLAVLSSRKPLRCVNISQATLKALGYSQSELLNYCGVPICINNSVKDMDVIVLSDDVNVIHTRSWEPEEIDGMTAVENEG